jgi:hypothetical protein
MQFISFCEYHVIKFSPYKYLEDQSFKESSSLNKINMFSFIMSFAKEFQILKTIVM